ncbi:hypothetical protein GDO81_019865 [Engystomops pustulosus]|uniref:WAP domain-containing protein n=1 Tax=Engystomops pustulosus TaxID=76066 RepID=A0AAV6YRR4_ENGPU|nr:hypothetical protein GDO81_019865 [Engystomops pustulosus]
MKMSPIQASFLGVFLCLVALRITSGATEKDGVCPPERFYKKINPNEVSPPPCKNDAGCPENQKCCSDNGARFCKPPARERDGSCPTSPTVTPTSERSSDMCTSDSKCAPGALCCFVDSGKRCTPDLGEKKGSCVSASRLFCSRPQRSLCLNDTGCSGTSKCCRVMCGMMCKVPA